MTTAAVNSINFEDRNKTKQKKGWGIINAVGTHQSWSCGMFAATPAAKEQPTGGAKPSWPRFTHFSPPKADVQLPHEEQAVSTRRGLRAGDPAALDTQRQEGQTAVAPPVSAATIGL